jgi:hypothetical protein
MRSRPGSQRDFVTMPRCAWVLNLDADLELAHPTGGYSPSNAVKRAMAHQVDALRSSSLIGPNDIVIDDTSPEGSVARGFVGRAWCPTNRALAIMKRAGATPEPHPSQEILRTVNARSFCAALGQTLPDAAFVTNIDEAIAKLSSTKKCEWRVKRNFGMAGRGHRKIDSTRSGGLSKGDIAAVAAAIRDEGGVQIEPNVVILKELGQHAMLHQNGRYETGALVVQECDAHGQWLRTSVAPANEEDTDAVVRSAMERELTTVAGALHSAGYFGPFGIDAFVHPNGFQPRSEINARYSMGFAVGFSLLDGAPPHTPRRSRE